MPENVNHDITITIYRWAGAWGPLKIKIPCGECTLTEDVIKDVMQNELQDLPLKLEVKDWLSVWWQPLKRLQWHAPIVFVNNKAVSQGVALNRGVLIEKIIKAHTKQTPIQRNHLFGKAGCPFCEKAKNQLNDAGVAFQYHDVVRNPRDLYEMLARVKPIIGHLTPVTVPQIWLDGKYIGGAAELDSHLNTN